MKHTKFFIFALVAAMTFSACGTDDTLQFYYPENGGTTGGGNTGGGSTGGNTGGESTDKNNTNKNVATANMPQVVRNAIGGLEFPKLKNNGTSYAIVHMDNTTGMLNYSTEWDDNMKSQRQKQTFFMTNMQPQYSNFNQRGTWYKMEEDLRNKAPKIDSDTLFIVKGGTIDPVGSESNLLGWKKNGASSETKKPGYIPIPKYFFVAVLKKEFNKSKDQYTYSAFGYWFLHENKAFEKGDKLGKYVVNIKTLEDKTGIDFFCNLPDETEKEVENVDAEALKKLWGFK